jgi:hypothetical protein
MKQWKEKHLTTWAKVEGRRLEEEESEGRRNTQEFSWMRRRDGPFLDVEGFWATTNFA